MTETHNCCILPVELDIDPFVYKPSYKSVLKPQLTAGPVTEQRSPRNVVAKGMKRFDIGKVAPPQPDIEVLSSTVVSVLAGNPGPFTLNGTNCYLVGSGKERALIDTGEALFGNEVFLERLERAMNIFGVEKISVILITHLHYDHWGGVSSLLQKYGPIPVRMIPMAEDFEHDCVGLPEKLGLKDSILLNGEIIKLEGATLKVLHTPGHAHNHAAFYFEEEGNIFSGDHVLGYGTTVLRDLKPYMESLYLMKNLNPKKLYCGHGPHIEDGMDLLTRYIKHRQEREDQVVRFLSEEEHHLVKVSLIVKSLYTKTTPARWFMATENIEKILIKLYREGIVKCFRKNGDELVEGSIPDLSPNHLDSKLHWSLSSRFSRI
eukprot:maker-scaffold_6-snap-gene-3.50-mRNA-1 protein AED:0.15 eAED:0.15 QI:0/0/0/1/0/0/2/0/375